MYFFSEEGTFNGVPVIFDLSDKDEVLKSTWMDWHGYEIRGSQSGTLSMSRLDRAMGNPFLHTDNIRSFSKDVNAWHHFDITYDGMGRFLVYVDNELCLDQIDTTVMSFNCFGFFMQAGTVIDNVIVRDDLIVPSIAVSTNSLKVVVEDSVGKAVSGVSITSAKQPVGQSVLSGVTQSEGYVQFTGIAVGEYSFNVSKTGYTPTSIMGEVAAGGNNTAKVRLQIVSTQPSQSTGGVPGFPIISVFIGFLLFVILVGLRARFWSVKISNCCALA